MGTLFSQSWKVSTITNNQLRVEHVVTTIIEAEEKETKVRREVKFEEQVAAAPPKAAAPPDDFDKTVLIDDETGGLNRDVVQVFVKKKSRPIDIKRLPRWSS